MPRLAFAGLLLLAAGCTAPAPGADPLESATSSLFGVTAKAPAVKPAESQPPSDLLRPPYAGIQ